MTVLDLFCGIGWGQALHELGIAEHGIDFDADVAATRALHEWQTTHADITTLNPGDFSCDVLIASPPCQSFSAAGKRRGLEDPRGQLVWQVPRWVGAVRPRVVICEQVPGVLPIWRAICQVFDQWGYRSWCGVLDAVQWGVPQTRKRAILIARLDGRSPLPPEPTHRPYQAGVAQDGGDPSLLPWVSMADALGWGATSIQYPTLATARTTGGPDMEKVGGSAARRSLYAERDAGRWVVDLRQKAPGDTYGIDNITRPVTAPSPMLGTKSGSQWLIGELTAGTKTSQWRQIGNAVAPPFARALLARHLDGDR